MTWKSDDPSLIGKHSFEARGLGLAPFRCVGFEHRVYKVAPDAPALPGGSCQYCGTAISECCVIQSADGKRFIVGTTCVDKTDDTGLIKSYKTSPAYRAHQRELRQAKDGRVVAEWEALTGVPANREKLAAVTVTTWKGSETWLDYALRAWGWCGMAGHARYLKQAKQILADAKEVTP